MIDETSVLDEFDDTDEYEFDGIEEIIGDVNTPSLDSARLHRIRHAPTCVR